MAVKWRCSLCDENDPDSYWDEPDGEYPKRVSCPAGHTFCDDDCCGCYASPVMGWDAWYDDRVWPDV